jgi:hypothetical protein
MAQMLNKCIPLGESLGLPFSNTPPSLRHGLDDGVFAVLRDPLIEEWGVADPILGCHVRRLPNDGPKTRPPSPVHNFRPHRATEGLLSGQ